jgi:hypothetical protein
MRYGLVALGLVLYFAVWLLALWLADKVVLGVIHGGKAR